MLSVRDLPALNALLNGVSALFLLAGYWCIRRGDKEGHLRLMLGAVGASTLFLISYLAYHLSVETVTRFRDPAWFRPIYLVILLTHTLLAAVLLPMVLRTLFLAWKQRWESHRRLARWTWPVWIYVCATGVVIYLLLYQIFPQRVFALRRSGMRVVEGAVERMRRGVAEVFAVEFAQGPHHGFRIAQGLGGKTVGFEFVTAREQVPERGEPETDGAPQQGSQQEGGRCFASGETEGLGKRR